MGDHFYRYLVEAYLGTLLNHPISELEVMDENSLLELANSHGVKIHFLKRLNNRRIVKSAGIVQGIYPESLLDIGVGKGFFIWFLIERLPELKLTCIDVSNIRIERIARTCDAAGLRNVSVEAMDAEKLDFPDRSFRMVSLFELLEHVANPERALKEAIRVTKEYIAFSMPCKPDDNKDHIHFFDEKKLLQLLKNCAVEEFSRIEKDSLSWYVLIRLASD